MFEALKKMLVYNIAHAGRTETTPMEQERMDELSLWLEHGAREASLVGCYMSLYPGELAKLPAGCPLDLYQFSLIGHDFSKAFAVKDVATWRKKRKDLTDAEWKEMRNHVFISESMLKKAGDNGVVIPPIFTDVATLHHEKLDGSGPYRLKGEQIPFHIRLAAIIDQLIGRLEPRDYHDGTYTLASAMADLMAGRDKFYDGRILDNFLSLFRQNRHQDFTELEWMGQWNEVEFINTSRPAEHITIAQTLAAT